MAVKNYLYTNSGALSILAGLTVFSLRCVAGEDESIFQGIKDFEVSEKRTKLSGCLMIILVGLLLVIVTAAKKTKACPRDSHCWGQ